MERDPTQVTHRCCGIDLDKRSAQDGNKGLLR